MKIERTDSRGHIFWFRCSCGYNDIIVPAGTNSCYCLWCHKEFRRGILLMADYNVPWEKGSAPYEVPAEKVIVPSTGSEVPL